MNESLQLVFNYFFAVGSGIGLGLVITIGVPVVVYRKITSGGGVRSWRSVGKNK